MPEKSPIPDEDGLHGLFLEVAGSYERIHSPFSSYMCGTREISEMYQKYSNPLDKAASAMRNLHLMMMLELVERIWGGDMPHRVTQQELEACGHPGWNAPNPVDCW